MSARIARVCVYCGSSPGLPPYTDAALRFVDAIAERGWDVVYGGGSVGLMGVVADAALARGRQVIGVIPRDLFAKEVEHRGITELIEVDTMHERKAMMAKLSNAFVALPGGLGTLEEIFEALTWVQIGIHAKPCGFLNANGYYTQLGAFLDTTVEHGFVGAEWRERIAIEEDPAALCAALAG